MKIELNKAICEQMISWRHHLHSIPEVGMEEKETSVYVADILRKLGCKVEEHIGGTGVVGVLKRGNSNKVIALRSDMDALPIMEQTGCSYESKNGASHACGHDGHMAMLLGAAAYLAERGDFDGSVCFLFQPAEETTAGAQAMIRDDVIERFSIEEIYGMHNAPFLSEGEFGMKPLGIMSGEDNFVIRIKGQGCHASTPHMGVDPILCFSEIYQSLQLAITRQSNAVYPIVISCTQIHTDGARNAIPATVEISGDVRCFRKEDSDFVKERMEAITESVCKLYGADFEVSYSRECGPILNDSKLLLDAQAAAESVVGKERVNAACDPWMASEDFSAFLDKIPGCYVLLGSHKAGTEIISLHSPMYDFNDDILKIGASYFIELVQRRLHPVPLSP